MFIVMLGEKVSDYIFKFNEDFFDVIDSNVKTSTIRSSSKPVNVGDEVYAYFPSSKKDDKVMLIKIIDHYAKKVKDLTEKEAYLEGYRHADLLKHELYNIYPNLNDNDYVYIYIFEQINDSDILSRFWSILEGEE